MSEAPKANKKVLGLFALAMINVAGSAEHQEFPFDGGVRVVVHRLVHHRGSGLFNPDLPCGSGTRDRLARRAAGCTRGSSRHLARRAGLSPSSANGPTTLSGSRPCSRLPQSTLAFALTPDLAANPWFMFSVMMIVFWGTTAIAYFGEEASTKFSNVGVIPREHHPLPSHHRPWPLVAGLGTEDRYPAFHACADRADHQSFHAPVLCNDRSSLCRNGDGRLPCP